MVVVETISRDEVEITFRLGKNALENHELIDDADPNDLWFHLDGFPSGHCILEVNRNNNFDSNNKFNRINYWVINSTPYRWKCIFFVSN